MDSQDLRLETRDSRLGIRSLTELLLGDWLENWRGMFARHDRTRQWIFIAIFVMVAATITGGVSYSAFKTLVAYFGTRMPPIAAWAGPFMAVLAYGWFFLCTIWLSRTYRRRERVIPLLLSPLPFPHLATYLMLRDTGLLFLMLTVLAYPFMLGGLLAVGAPTSLVVLSLPLWLLTLGGALAMANGVILALFRLLPAGWEGPMSFATANVLILMLPFLTKGLWNPWVPFYWPGLLAKEVLKAAPGWPQVGAIALLATLTAGLFAIGVDLTRRCLHANWSKSEELVPSKFLGKLSFLAPGQHPMATVILKDWLMTSRAWGEVLIVLLLLGVAFRLRAEMGLPVVEMSGAPLLGALIMAWAMVELLAFLGESHKEGQTTLLLSLSPLSPKALVWAKFTSIALPRLLLGEFALLIASAKGDLVTPHVLIGQVGLITMVTILSWLEVPQAFQPSEGKLPGWLKVYDRFYDFWRLLLIYPAVGLLCVIGTQVAAYAWDQGVTGLTGVCLGVIGLVASLAAMFSGALVKRKLG